MGPIEAATRADLESMGEAAKASALGASAIDLARRQDEAFQPNFAAQLAKELRATLDRLTDLHPPRPQADRLDELRAKREAKGA
jgi:hypothetical protein